MNGGSCVRIVLLVLWLLCGFSQDSLAQSSTRGPKINRIFVPAGKPETWPAGDWIPIAPERLQTLLTQQSQPTPKTLVVNEARLLATFDPQRNALVSGRAVVSFSERTPTNRLVSLSPLNVSVRNPRWARANSRSVVMGFDEWQQLQIAVPPDAGELQFDWQLAGTSRLNGSEFELRLPRAIVGEVSIDVPKLWSLSAGAMAVKAETQASGWQRFTINAVPGQTLRLLLSPESLKAAEHATSTSLLYRQTTTLQLSRGRLDQRSDFVLDSLSVVPAIWQMPVPKDWTCEAISLNGRLLTAAEWSLKATGPGPQPMPTSGEQLLSVPLPNGNGSSSPAISVRMSRTLGAGVKLATCVVPAPQHDRAVLLAGQVDLQVVSSLALVRTELRDLRQTETRSDEGIDRLTFQQDKSGAQLTLHWADQAELLRLESRQFVVVNLEDSPASFLTDIEVKPQTGSLFEISVKLPRQWELSEVVILNGSGVGRRVDWTVLPSEVDQQLKVSFPDGVTANSAVMVRLNGHYVGAAKATDLAAPIGILSRGNPEALLVAVTAPTTAATLVAPNNRFQVATSEIVSAARSWTQLAKVAADKNSRVWAASSLDSSVDLRESRLRTQAAAEPTLPSQSVTSVVPPDSATSKPSVVKSKPSDFQPHFSAKLRSTLSPGRASRDQHELSLKLLYPSESGLLEFELPQQAQLQHVEWHGQRIAATNVGTKLSVPLQAPKVSDELQIHYTLPAEAFFLRETYQAEIPVVSAPIDGVEWEVRLPSRFIVVRFPGDFALSSDEEAMHPHWLAWLFGPLARRPGDGVFNPFNASDWQPLFVGDSGTNSSAVQSDESWESYVARAPRVPESLAIEVCDRQRLTATAWLILAATACVGVILRASKSKQRNGVAVVWLTLAVAGTVLIPVAYAELLGATIVGSVLACLAPRGLIRRDPKAPSQRHHDRHFAPTVTVQQGLLGLLLVVLSWRAVTAQEATPNVGLSVETVDLLIEYEGDRFAQPLRTGLVCVTATTLEQLVRNVAPSSTPPRALFQGAQYEGDWSINGLSKLVAKWELWLPHVPLNKGAALFDEVTLPLPLRTLVDIGQVRADGQPIEVVPNANGQSVRVRVPKVDPLAAAMSATPPVPEERVIPLADKWRLVTLETELRPLPLRSFHEVAWQVPVPRTLSSDVAIGQRDPVIERPAFSSGWVAQPERLGAGSFDPVSELRLIQRRPDARGTQATVSVKQKSFVEAMAESSRRITLGQYFVNDGELKQVAWKLPPHAIVQTERIVAPQLRAAQIRRSDSETLLLCEFSPPHSSEFTIAIPWMLPERLTDAPKSLVWERPVVPLSPYADLAVSEHVAGATTGLGFAWRPVSNIPMSLGTEGETEFMAGWPSTLAPRAPQLVWHVAGQPAPQWRLVPNVSEKAARWTTVTEVDRESIVWQFAADVDVAGAPAFVHELEIDPRITVESVTVTQDDVNRLAYWTRQADRLWLHLRDRVTGPQKIVVTARETNRTGEVVAHPRCELVGAKTGDLTLKVLRSRGVIVDVVGADLAPNAEFDMDSETRLTNPVDVGTFRAKAQAEASLMVRLLPVVSRSWCVATIDASSSEPVVELSFNIEPGRLERTQLTLPQWPIADGVTAEIDGDPSATMTRQADSTDRWVISIGKSTDLPLHVLMRVPIVEADEMLAVELAAPRLEDVAEQTVGWMSPLRRQEGTVASDVLPSSQHVEMLERGIVSPTLIGVPIVDWKQTALSVPRTSLAVERFNELPLLAHHDVWLGDRDQISARTTVLAMTAAGKLSVNLPLNAELRACLVNNVPRATKSGGGVLNVPLDESNVLAVIELIWLQRDEVRALRIGQRQIALPKIQAAKVLERATVGLSDTRRAMPIQALSSTAVQEWQVAVDSWSTETAVRPSLLTNGVATALNRFREDTTNDERETRQSHRQVRFESVTNSLLRIWVIDERLDRVVIALVIALLVAPIVRLLIQFRTGDWLAARPAVAFGVLSAIWWLCLHGSGLGLAALGVAAIWAITHWVQRAREESLIELQSASASPSRSRHSF